MTFVVRITPTALEDAIAIGLRIASEGAPANAERWVARILADLDSLAEFRERHPLAPEGEAFADSVIRHRLFGDFRILFTVVEDAVIVLHVRHERREPATPEEMIRRLRS